MPLAPSRTAPPGAGAVRGTAPQEHGAARRPALRDDLVALAGYHSPQLDVAVRLNTNESPFPPPDAFVADLQRELASVEWHRYPDRAATELRRAIGALHGVGPEQVFVANGSNEVIQTVCLAFAGAGRAVLTFEPTYAMHGQIARTTQSDGDRGRAGR